MLKENIREMIKNDISKCEQGASTISGSYDLYGQMCAKYSKLDKNFTHGIQTTGKVCTSDGFDYRKELKQLVQILTVYLELDEIPIQYKENVAIETEIQINAKNIKNIGNIGKDNSFNSSKEANFQAHITTEKKECWLKRIFHKRSKQ